MADLRKLVLVLASLALLAEPALAKSLKCVDRKGVTHYGDNIPEGCSDRPVYELDDKGIVVKENPASLTPEQRRELENEIKLKEEAAHRERDQARKDNALTSTYANEAEIDMALERNLQQVQLTINSIDSRIQTTKNRQRDYQKQADDAAKSGKPVPGYINENLRNISNEIGKLEAERAQKMRETESIKAKFAADKKRYQELTQKQPEKQ